MIVLICLSHACWNTNKQTLVYTVDWSVRKTVVYRSSVRIVDWNTTEPFFWLVMLVQLYSMKWNENGIHPWMVILFTHWIFSVYINFASAVLRAQFFFINKWHWLVFFWCEWIPTDPNAHTDITQIQITYTHRSRSINSYSMVEAHIDVKKNSMDPMRSRAPKSKCAAPFFNNNNNDYQW